MRRSATPLLCSLGAALLSLSICPGVHADEGQRKTRQLRIDEIEAWLESRAIPGSSDIVEAEPLEVPPRPPRRHGFVIESSIGAMGHLGPLKHVSPTAPWFHAKLGFEPFNFIMLFAEADAVIASTAYANPPPAPRSYALMGFGGGLRLTAKFSDFGAFAQGEIGGALATEDVLTVYGYQNADQLGYYMGAQLGFEWYQVSPHYALAVHGGFRNYPELLARQQSSEPPLTWLAAVALRYTL